eukprot:4067612-Alexandrium_andersonii.AAC.1
MTDVTGALRSETPWALAPMCNFCDIEFADDATLVCKTAQAAQFVPVSYTHLTLPTICSV